MALTDKLTAIADAIRGKTGKADALTLEQMVAEIEEIQTGGGDDDLWNRLIGRSVTEVIYAGGDIGTAAFYGCDMMHSISAPNATSASSQAFRECYKLTDVFLPNVEKLGGAAFRGCSGLTEIDLPKVWYAGGGETFYGCTSLVRLKLPLLTTTTSSSLASGCSSLEEVDLPLLTSLKGQEFKNCKSLEKVNLPLIGAASSYSFQYCTALSFLDLPSVSRIQGSAFDGATALSALVLRNETACTLDNVSAFKSTPFAVGGVGGTVYVPSALIESYQTATNWSTLYAAGTCNFVAIEGSEYE